jgi:DNA mismatch repair protein MutS
LAGLPEPVLARAQAVLAELEAGPSGNAPTPAASKKSAKAPTPQLDLFAAPPVSGGQRSAIDTLVAVDVDRLTPLDALQLVARLRELVRS